jgi:hypothetical protein
MLKNPLWKKIAKATARRISLVRTEEKIDAAAGPAASSSGTIGRAPCKFLSERQAKNAQNHSGNNFFEFPQTRANTCIARSPSHWYKVRAVTRLPLQSDRGVANRTCRHESVQ